MFVLFLVLKPFKAYLASKCGCWTQCWTKMFRSISEYVSSIVSTARNGDIGSSPAPNLVTIKINATTDSGDAGKSMYFSGTCVRLSRQLLLYILPRISIESYFFFYRVSRRIAINGRTATTQEYSERSCKYMRSISFTSRRRYESTLKPSYIITY